MKLYIASVKQSRKGNIEIIKEKFNSKAEALDYAKRNKSISTKWLYKVVEPLANSLQDKEYILIKTLE